MQDLFEQTFKEHEKALFLVAVGYLHNTEDALDCVQEAALCGFLNYGKLRRKEYFKTWMTRIVINKAKDFLRKKRYTEQLTDDLAVFCDLSASDMELLDAVCTLPPKLSQYITLRFYRDLTYKEVAHLLKQPISTVKYRTEGALKALESILKGDVLP